MDRLDLIRGSASHYFQVSVKGIGLGLDEFRFQGQHGFLIDFFAIGIMDFAKSAIQNLRIIRPRIRPDLPVAFHQDGIMARGGFRVGIRHLPLYSLRHTNCSLLISSRELSVEEIAARMGHEQTSTTLNIYSHAFRDANEKATAALENVLKNAE